jgi:hypothetical protein
LARRAFPKSGFECGGIRFGLLFEPSSRIACGPAAISMTGVRKSRLVSRAVA